LTKSPIVYQKRKKAKILPNIFNDIFLNIVWNEEFMVGEKTFPIFKKNLS